MWYSSLLEAWKKLSKNQHSICKELWTNNITYRDPTEIAEVFSEYYPEISDSNDERYSDGYGSISDKIENHILNKTLSFDEVDTGVKSVKLQTSPGVDKIPNELLGHTLQQCLLLITKLFSAIITVGPIPTIGKKGLVILVHKRGSKPSDQCESYISIALWCSFNKLLRRLFSQEFNIGLKYFETFSVIYANKQQQGFTKSLNCITTTLIRS